MGVEIRWARPEDVPSLVRLLADDTLGASREQVACDVPAAYRDAFLAIETDPHNHLVIAEDDGGVVGMCQLTLIPGLAHQGAWRVQVEAVRVASDRRGEGIGRTLLEWTLDYARQQGARIAQLTTDKSRHGAHRFYADLGFTASHEGMKLVL